MFLRVNSKLHAENVHPLPGLHKGILLLQKTVFSKSGLYCSFFLSQVITVANALSTFLLKAVDARASS